MDSHGTTLTTLPDIIATFVFHLRHKYKPIEVDGPSIDNLQNFLRPVCPTKYAAILEQPISFDELLAALRAGARHKSPGINGIFLEFYTGDDPFGAFTTP
jgi:hypothetical protein